MGIIVTYWRSVRGPELGERENVCGDVYELYKSMQTSLGLNTTVIPFHRQLYKDSKMFVTCLLYLVQKTLVGCQSYKLYLNKYTKNIQIYNIYTHIYNQLRASFMQFKINLEGF